jgi:poly(3-hydroxybutyrate) depolymerase
MQRIFASAAVTILMVTGTSIPAGAELIEKSGTFGGVKLTYKVVLPDGYDATRTYPTVLVFTGGPQTLQMAANTLESDWRKEGERRGYILVSPGTPDGSLFFEGADRVFPEFLEQLLRDYKVKGGKFHVAGHSNGGLSAFHVAARYPQYVGTLTGYPGLLDGPDVGKMSVLKSMCIFMHVGDQDSGWMTSMQRQADEMKKQGFNVRFTVEKNQVHRLKASEIDLSNRLYQEIESCN